MSFRLIKQIGGGLITVVSIGLCYVFLRSEAWFGVMIGLFMGAVGLKAMWQPDVIFAKGTAADEHSPPPSGPPASGPPASGPAE